jgi:hypothetical protein
MHASHNAHFLFFTVEIARKVVRILDDPGVAGQRKTVGVANL